VPVGELLDAIDATVRSESGPAREAVVVRHPLQPFDPRNFTAGELIARAPWSYDQTAADGARALCDERQQPEPFLRKPLAAHQSSVLELDEVIRFAERPVRGFLHQRLGISVSEVSDELDEALTLELDNLEQWAVGQRLLEGRLRGLDAEACLAAERARGTLPPGELADPIIARVQPVVEEVAAQATQHLGSAPAASVGVLVALEDRRTLSGTVAGLRGATVGAATYSRVNPRQRIAMWVRLLALTAAHPECAYETVLVGRVRSGGGHGAVTIARLAPLAADEAQRALIAHEQLAKLIDIYDRGMREPLPLPGLTAAAYAEAVHKGRNPEPAARKAFESTYKYDKEDQEPEHRRAFEDVVTLSELLDKAPRADEQGEGWFDAEPSRLARYALRLWTPILAHEVLLDT
jgi:exodeoxyribonuclease V gamma subunit